MSESIVIICPDTNIKLWINRVADAAIGGGKSAILQLADAWARASFQVTIAGAFVEESESHGVRLREIRHAAGTYDVAIYVTGSRGNFDEPSIENISARLRLLWMNSPNRVSPPSGPLPDLFIAPARFLGRRAIDEWGFPAERTVVIPGESVSGKSTRDREPREERAIVYASHPFKGLNQAVDVIGRLVPEFPGLRLDVFGSAKLHGDNLDATLPATFPPWVSFKGGLPQREVEAVMARYGAMLYATEWLDGFSLATAEAMAAGVVVIATDHGSNADLIRHGWNGLLMSSGESHKPDLKQAEELLRWYLTSPSAFDDMRERAAGSVQSWDHQAREWTRAWRNLPGRS